MFKTFRFVFCNIPALIILTRCADLFIISAGVGYSNPELDWEPEVRTVDINVRGFIALAHIAFKTFATQRSGHPVNISSIAAIRGNAAAPAYGASKAFESIYTESLRHKLYKQRMSITINDIQPGFVDTDMAKGPGRFWVATPEKAAQQIYNAIQAKPSHAYITKRRRIIAWILMLVPDFVSNRL